MESTPPAAPIAAVEDPIVRVTNLYLLLRAERGAAEHHPRLPPQPGDGADRPVGLRQIDAAALPQPHERPDRRRAAPRAAILLDDQPILDKATDVIELRRKVGMVFQKPTPFAKSIYENVAYGLRIGGVSQRRDPRRGGGKEPAAAPPSGTRSRTACTNRPWASPAGSTSGCASPGRSPSIRRSFSWTSPVRRWTPARRRASRTSSASLRERVHDHHRDAQFAAGRPGVRLHGLSLRRRVDRIRADEGALHQAGEEGDGGLSDGKVWVEGQSPSCDRTHHLPLSDR